MSSSFENRKSKIENCLHVPDRVLSFSRPLVMGIVNVTPDSFSDGGLFAATEAAIAHGQELVRQGADLLDIGGESSRPGAEVVPLEEELRRVMPVIRALVGQTSIPISVDTYKAEVARQALEAGALIVNDIFALRGDPDMADVISRHRAGVILMHMRGEPQTMQRDPTYANVVEEVAQFLEERLQTAGKLGIAREQVVLDPGIGFGKRHLHNLQLLARLEEFQRLGRPVCLGVSRKGFIGKICDRSPQKSAAGSVAVACHALARHAAQILRVHDVEETRDAVKMFGAIEDVSKEMGG